MALYRTISMSFWTDSKITDDFTPEDKYFYLYLITNPHTNLCGCYEISMKQIVMETGYSIDTVERLLIRFEEVYNVIRYSRITKELMILNWHKYNWTKSDKFRKPLLAEIRKIKNEEFKEHLSKIANGDDVRYPIHTKCIDTNYIDTSVTNTNTVSDTDTDTITDVDTKTGEEPTQKKTSGKSYPDEFVRFWDIYPRNDNKSGSYEKFSARLKEGELAENLITAASNYAAKCKKNHTQREYIMMATTFLGPHLRYMDYLPKEPQKPKYTETDGNPFDAFVEG